MPIARLIITEAAIRIGNALPRLAAGVAASVVVVMAGACLDQAEGQESLSRIGCFRGAGRSYESKSHDAEAKILWCLCGATRWRSPKESPVLFELIRKEAFDAYVAEDGPGQGADRPRDVEWPVDQGHRHARCVHRVGDRRHL